MTTNPSRRQAFGFAASAVPAVLSGFTKEAQAHADMALLALGERFEASWKRETALFATCADDDLEDENSEVRRAYRCTQKLVNEIHDMRAFTLDGLRVKARAILWCRGDGAEQLDDKSFGSTTDARISAGIVRSILSIV